MTFGDRLPPIHRLIFCSWLRSCTNLKGSQVYDLFELFDVDRSGTIDFDEFYLVIAILVAVKVWDVIVSSSDASRAEQQINLKKALLPLR